LDVMIPAPAEAERSSRIVTGHWKNKLRIVAICKFVNLEINSDKDGSKV
jgi:hypothetical protein